jgi:type VI secretion system protein ImpA
MAEDPIDLDALLAPLSDGDGAGVDLREDYTPTSPYQRLRDARGAARAEERARDSDGELDPTPAEGWRDVSRVAQEVLAGRSKDFEVAAWLTEALVRHHGLAGVTAGAKLIAGLCDQFWNNGFPAAQDEGLEDRNSAIGGLAGSGADGTIMQPLRRLAIFHRADRSPLGLYQWDQAEETEAIVNAERKQARRDAGVPELATLEAEARLDRAYLQGVARGAEAALAAWRAMETTLETWFGSDTPATRNVANLLERMIEVTRRLGGAEAAAEEPEAAEAAAGPAGAPAAAAGGGGGGGPAVLRTREDALRELGRVAEFFRRTEPHSPLAYTLEEAVRRGRMTLPELLMEILPDEDTRSQMLSRLGIRPDTQQ